MPSPETVLPPFSGSEQDASAPIREYCGWHIWPDITETLTVDGHGGRHLFLPTMRLISIASIIETERSQSSVTLVADQDFYWSENGTVERIGTCWTTRPRGITITFTHGWREIPKPVEDLAATLGARLASNPQRAKQMSMGGRSLTLDSSAGAAGGLLLDEAAMIARYRRIV